MILLATVILLLLATVSGLLFFPWSGWDAADRDTLNRAFYLARLRELEQERIPGQQEMIAELQQNLLADIPAAQPAQRQPFGRGILVTGVLLLVGVSLGFFLKTSHVSQVLLWQQQVQQTPALIKRVMDPDAAPLTLDEMAQLSLGLRTKLQHDPQNSEGWLMLGRLNMVLGDGETAELAFKRASQLVPDNINAKLDYAEILIRSADPQRSRQGEALAREVVARQQTNIRALGLLAFSAYGQQHYDQAIAAWQLILRLLPPEDARRAAFSRAIERAKAQRGVDKLKLAVTITLSPEAEKNVPLQGALFISVTDGASALPVAVKKLPLSHFPLTVTLDDTNAMMPDRPLSGLHQGKVKVHISRDGTPTTRAGDWIGESALTRFDASTRVDVRVAEAQP